VTDSDNKIFVVDDDASVRRSTARLLHSAGYEVETLATAEAYLNLRNARGAGCLVLDLQMPGLNGLQLQQALIDADMEVPIVFVSGRGNIPSSVQAMKRGAVDFLTKPYDQKDFLEAIKKALYKGEQLRKSRSEQKSIDNRLEHLTHRERQVLSQVVKGKLNKQIAMALKISEKTVKVHRARVMEKMRVESVAALVRMTEKIQARDDASSEARKIFQPAS